MTTQRFQQIMATLQSPLQKAVYKFIYSRNIQGALLSQIQEHLARAKVTQQEIQQALRHLRDERHIYIKQKRIIAQLFNPQTQNLDPWFESIDHIDSQYVEKLKRAVLGIINQKHPPNLQSLASQLRTGGVCRTDLSEAQIRRIVDVLISEQYVYKLGDSYYIAGRNRIGESLACTVCGQCEYIGVCDAEGLGARCKWMEQWLEM